MGRSNLYLHFLPAGSRPASNRMDHMKLQHHRSLTLLLLETLVALQHARLAHVRCCLSPNKAAFALMNLSVQRLRSNADNGSHLTPPNILSLQGFLLWGLSSFIQCSFFLSLSPTFFCLFLIN